MRLQARSHEQVLGAGNPGAVESHLPLEELRGKLQHGLHQCGSIHMRMDIHACTQGDGARHPCMHMLGTQLRVHSASSGLVLCVSSLGPVNTCHGPLGPAPVATRVRSNMHGHTEIVPELADCVRKLASFRRHP